VLGALAPHRGETNEDSQLIEKKLGGNPGGSLVGALGALKPAKRSAGLCRVVE
jgi:hypothetical protein